MQESIIFKAAVKLPAGERAAYLDKTCGVNAALRLEVEGLLRAHEQPGQFMHRPPIADMTTDHGSGPDRPGMRIGPYKLLQYLGEGGMGAVFLAEQSQPVRRMVALKIIKPGMDSSQILARFEAERQALAIMDHPNIAKIFDAGTTQTGLEVPARRESGTNAEAQNGAAQGEAATIPQGRPYFVMELVKGVPITEFCDKNKLTTKQRLELFVPVCQAIQHAHMKGIIHRDIKPSNVLIALYDGKPVPKVIDFGVAKAMAEPLTQRTLFTQVGQIVGTFEYMSPEQATLNQLDIDTRSDIYSLGVLLYELLTGMTPFDKDQLRKLALDQMLRTIREKEPMRPSVRLSSEAGALAMAAAYRGVESQKLTGVLRGDLDWIVMKCLEKERNRRFVTAGSLAQDIERYLNDEPVTACPPSLSYRARKAYRKNKVAIVTTGAIIATLLLGVMLTGWQAILATHAKREALARQNEAETAKIALENKNTDLQKKHEALMAAREQLRWTHYAASMSFIRTAWDADNVPRAIELLEENRPKTGETDIRDFEWHYWDRLCHAERRKWVCNVGGNAFAAPQLSGDGRRLFVTKSPLGESGEAVVSVWDTASEREIFTVKPGVFSDAQQSGGGVTVSVSHDGRRVACHLTDRGRGPFPNLNVTPRPKVDHPFLVYEVGRAEPIFEKTLPNGVQMVLSPDGRRLAIQENVLAKPGPPGEPQSTRIRIWDLSRPDDEPFPIKFDDENISIGIQSFNPDGTRLLGIVGKAAQGPAALGESTIHIWESATGALKIRQPIKFLTGPSRVGFSANGKRIAMTVAARDLRAGNLVSDATLIIYDGADGDALTQRPDLSLNRSSAFQGGFIQQLVFSPDGRRLAIPGGLAPTQIVDVDAMQVIQTIKSSSTMGTAAFNADGTRLFTAGRALNGLFNLRRPTGECVYSECDLVPYPKPAAPVARQPQSDLVTFISANGQRKVVFQRRRRQSDDQPPEAPNTDLTVRDDGNRLIGVFKKHTTPISSADISPDGRWVCSTGSKEVFFWEADTGEVHWQGEIPATPPEGSFFGMRSGGFSRDSHWFLRPDEDGYKLVSLPDLQERANLGPISTSVFSPDNRRLVTTLNKTRPEPMPNTTTRAPDSWTLWDLENAREIVTRNITNASPFATAVFSPDSRIIVMNGQNQTSIVNAATGAEMQLANDVRGGRLCVFSPDGSRVLLAGPGFGRRFNSYVSVVELATGKTLFRLEGLTGQIGNVVFSPNGRRIATLSVPALPGKMELKIWDADTGRELLSSPINDYPRPGNAGLLSFSPDGHRLTMTPRRPPPFDTGEAAPLREPIIWDATPREEPGKQP